jgi:hypothetical protein
MPSSSTAISCIIACYNTGSVSGNTEYIGGICGKSFSANNTVFSDNTVSACFWKDIPDDNADYGIVINGFSGAEPSDEGTAIFDNSAWPTESTHLQWGTGDGKYWKSLGGWNNGNPVYPKLYFE